MARGLGLVLLAVVWAGCGETQEGGRADADTGSDVGDSGVPLPAIGCGGGCPAGTAYADQVVEAPGSAGLAEHLLATNGVRGGGDTQGGADVLSIGLESGDRLVLSWSGRRVTNGAGADFVVFENAFDVATGGRFMDPTLVEVSLDGESWFAFPHDYRAPDERAYSNDPLDWPGFAGLTPVRYHEDDNPVDPFGPEAGGDTFDLDHLPLPEAAAVVEGGFTRLRLSGAAAHTNPDTGEAYPREPVATGPDIDGVYARYLVAQP